MTALIMFKMIDCLFHPLNRNMSLCVNFA